MSYKRGIISTYASGVDLVVEWKIENFFNLPERDGAFYYSPDFSFGGERWHLGIFTNGSSRNDSSGHVDLSLWKYFSGRSIKQSFSLSLKTGRGEKYNEQHGTKDFENDISSPFNRFTLIAEIFAETCELLRFIPRSELSRRKSELLPEGALTVICTMKSSTSGRSYTGNNPEHAYVGASAQHVGASAQHVGASTQRVGASTQSVGASTQTVEVSTQTVEVKCEACASGSSLNSQEKRVLHDLKELFLNKEDCDVTIKVEGSEFPAHRAILKMRSPVFASTFRHDMKENATDILVIEDCHPSTFSDFLCFLYCGDIGIISQENVFDLYTAADKYQILDLRAKCLEFMKKNITVDTFCETLTLALRHSETELIKLCTNYFKENIPKIIVTVKWQTFLAENPTQSNELLVKCLVPNSS